MERLENLRREASLPMEGAFGISDILYAGGISAHFDDPYPITLGHGIAAMFAGAPKYVYPSDVIAGSMRGLYGAPFTQQQHSRAAGILNLYGSRSFITNADHFAPDYAAFLRDGVGGTLRRIEDSMAAHRNDPDAARRLAFLTGAKIAMEGFSEMIAGYADAADSAALTYPENAPALRETAACCRSIVREPPRTFRAALQLVWLCHLAFNWEKRYAMAFGRMDQFLYPFYRRDIDAGLLTDEQALEYLECTLYKIAEGGRSDVCNIAIGGVKRDGSCAVNELSYLLLRAVERCAVPGPNLSARISSDTPDAFLDACLQVIGSGIGYPALMNDEINIPALARHGYAIEDCRDYCMVGCIENFLPGMQPPWSDGRYNSPKYLELTLNNGRCMLSGVQMGPETGDASEIASMEDFLARLDLQMKAGAAEYMANFRCHNDRFNRFMYSSPFLSCFCRDCIGRGLDINDGGALYPSVHGAGCMGIGTMADSLAAIERMVFDEKRLTLSELRDVLLANFEGCPELKQQLLAMPKYGNNDDFADKYAVWYVQEHARIFDRYRTPDGGAVYIAIASNVSNIPAGREIAATPDGRGCGEPLSDAASPMHGMDTSGPSAVVLSTSKPDYRLVSCGTVLNQKYSPSMFSDPAKRAKLLALIRVYFRRGGQEIQINSVSRAILTDAMEHPEQYRSLVVRVSGFSAFYVTLDRAVQEDILKRTEQG